jgi:hypothetical protein
MEWNERKALFCAAKSGKSQWEMPNKVALTPDTPLPYVSHSCYVTTSGMMVLTVSTDFLHLLEILEDSVDYPSHV